MLFVNIVMYQSSADFSWILNHIKRLIPSYIQNLCFLNSDFGGGGTEARQIFPPSKCPWTSCMTYSGRTVKKASVCLLLSLDRQTDTLSPFHLKTETDFIFRETLWVLRLKVPNSVSILATSTTTRRHENREKLKVRFGRAFFEFGLSLKRMFVEQSYIMCVTREAMLL